ncbi:glycosyltransferase family 2 protein [Elongatibacter sediminis]|uniref:Glycosyltransferase family 2 protein n=1 Tax=Elongatibacter sediminis TaxID=3119006 RepID=A0AAW9RC11_9GAMM
MAREAPLVSILVTVYNRESSVGETLSSVLRSDYCNFEVIVVDDCSSDGSQAIVSAFAEGDKRIRVHRNERNLGDYPNRNKAASLAKGRYLKYVDSDDLIYPHGLSVMVAAMEANPDAVLGLAHSMPEEETPYPCYLQPHEAYRKQFLGRGCLSCGPTGAIIRRDAFEAAAGFCAEWDLLADMELWYRLAACAPVVLLPPGLVWWRRHSGQEFERSGAVLQYLQKGYELDRETLLGLDCPLEKDERDTALARRRQHVSRRLMSHAARNRAPGEAIRVFRGADLSWRDLLAGLRRYR